MRTLIVIPAFNEAESLPNVISSLNEKCPNADYVIINDGSSDNTKELAENNKWNIVNLPVNIGLSGAFQTGMIYGFISDYDAVLQFDGDGQHDAGCASKLISMMNDNEPDIVIGSRFLTMDKTKSMRMFGSRLLTFAIRITTGTTINDPTSGMRLYNKKMIRIFANNINYGPEPDTIAFLIRNGANVSEVQVEMHDRTAGKSYLTFSKSIRYMINMFFSILFIQFFRKGDEI